MGRCDEMKSLQDRAAQSAQLLQSARYAVALTGAGISTPSGIPDFRSAGSGLWAHSDPMYVCSIDTFRRRPQVFFDWLRPLLGAIRQAAPNPAHHALASLEAQGLLGAIITQNIDDMHGRAGSRHVLEVHGSLRDAACVRCHALVPTESFVAKFLADGEIPQCPSCQGMLKPNIVLYGEMLPETVFTQAREAAERCDVMIVAGSSLEVTPASELPRTASWHGAHIIVVNRDPTYIDADADVVFREDVAEALPLIAAACAAKNGGETRNP